MDAFLRCVWPCGVKLFKGYLLFKLPLLWDKKVSPQGLLFPIPTVQSFGTFVIMKSKFIPTPPNLYSISIEKFEVCPQMCVRKKTSALPVNDKFILFITFSLRHFSTTKKNFFSLKFFISILKEKFWRHQILYFPSSSNSKKSIVCLDCLPHLLLTFKYHSFQ